MLPFKTTLFRIIQPEFQPSSAVDPHNPIITTGYSSQIPADYSPKNRYISGFEYKIPKEHPEYNQNC